MATASGLIRWLGDEVGQLSRLHSLLADLLERMKAGGVGRPAVDEGTEAGAVATITDVAPSEGTSCAIRGGNEIMPSSGVSGISGESGASSTGGNDSQGVARSSHTGSNKGVLVLPHGGGRNLSLTNDQLPAIRRLMVIVEAACGLRLRWINSHLKGKTG
jgi:hypothetical protein